MTETKKSPSMLRLIVVLFVIAVVVAFLLGFVNYITADRIAEIKEAKTNDAVREVLSADTYDEIEYTGGNQSVNKIYAAGDAGYVVNVTTSGFGGAIDMVVGVDTSGTVTGISIIDMSETSGLGDNAIRDTFRDQFIGATDTLAVSKDGGTIDALTGATITSRAVTDGVNIAMEAVKTLG